MAYLDEALVDDEADLRQPTAITLARWGSYAAHGVAVLTALSVLLSRRGWTRWTLAAGVMIGVDVGYDRADHYLAQAGEGIIDRRLIRKHEMATAALRTNGAK